MTLKFGIVTAGVICMSLVASQAYAKDLVYGSWNGSKNVVLTEGVGPYLKAVSEASKGSMKWKMVAGAQLFDGRATLSGINNRLADAGGPVVPAFTRKALRAANVVYDLIHLSDNPIVMAGAVAETYHLNCPACKADFKKNGSIFIANYAAAPFTMLCRMPVKTAGDLKGKKIRVVGALGRFIKSLGAVPVGGPPTKAVQAVQRGNMDCIVGPASWIKSFGMWDITKHVLDVSLAIQATPSSMVINEKIWKGLSKADRALMIKHAPSLIANTTIKGYMAEDVAVRGDAAKRGISIVKASKAFQALLDAHKVKEPKIIAAVAKKEGVKDPDSIVNAHIKNVEKWTKIYARIGDDPDKFAKALWDEVFSKLDPENM